MIKQSKRASSYFPEGMEARESKTVTIKRWNKKSYPVCHLRHCNNQIRKGKRFCTEHNTFDKRLSFKIKIIENKSIERRKGE